MTNLRPGPRRTPVKRRRSTGPGRPEAPLSAAERHALLVQAAIEVIARNGLAGASTRAVAAVAGMNQAMVHYSFPGKHALLLAVLETIHADLRKLLTAAVDGAASLGEAIERLARRMWELVLADTDLQRVQYELTLYALSSPGGARVACVQYQGYLDVLAGTLARVRSVRATPARLRAFAGVCVATMDGLILQHLALGDDAGRQRLELAVTALQALARDSGLEGKR